MIIVFRPADLLATCRQALPGLAVAGIATAASIVVNRLLPTVSPLLTAIVLGALLANIHPVPDRWRSGLGLCAKQLMRTGIVLLGLGLSFADILGLGPGMIVVVLFIVGGGMAAGLLVGRALGLSWPARLLIAAGFSICGAAAVAAVEGVIEDKDKRESDVLTAIALVVVFGTAMIPLIPWLGSLLGLRPEQRAMWAGGSIHEVAQVVAAGGAIGGGVLGLAVVVKLARVLLLAPVIAVIGLHRRRLGADRKPPVVQLFVVGFIIAAAVRSTGILPPQVLDVAAHLQAGLLTAAMFALGAGVRLSALRTVGYRPFVLALITTAAVAGIALVGVLLAG